MRLFTRADLDGIASVAMIMDMEEVEDLVFAHPKDMQDGLLEVQVGDGITNLPFHENARLWFDHNPAGGNEDSLPEGVKGKVANALSSARLIYDYYNSPELDKYKELLDETDRLESANLSFKDVLLPEGWLMLGYTLDPRTGLGGFREYSFQVIDAIRSGKSIEDILRMKSVRGRIDRYFMEEEIFKRAIMTNSSQDVNVSITDFRNLDRSPTGNRYMVYVLYARCDVNVRIYRHRDVEKTVVAVGKSVFNRNHPMHIGNLMAEYGGGGPEGAGTCTLEAESADETIKEIINRLKRKN